MKTQETTEDIIAEMRRGFDRSWHDIDREWANGLPDRLEAALKRERDAVEADALIVGGVVEAERHKPVRERRPQPARRIPDWCVMDAAVDVRSQWLVENLTPSQRAYARELAIERNRLK